MPSPFPGMDPFLEHPDIFPGLQDRLIAYVSEASQPNLPPDYFADIGRRSWVEISERYIGPDIQVLRDELPRGKTRRLVNSIEILSPTNKMPREHNRDLYLKKQREILDSKVNLVEIDLLRGGEHTTTVPEDRLLLKAGSFEFHVCIHRFDSLEDCFVYPIRLADPLPNIAIPLLPKDPAVSIDLQAVFTRAYDTGPYRREIDYRRDRPTPPLPASLSRWSKKRLAERS